MPKIFFPGVPCTPPKVNGYLFEPVVDHEPFYAADVADADLGSFFIGEEGTPYTLTLPGKEKPATPPPPAGDGTGPVPVTAESLLAEVNKIQKKADIATWVGEKGIGALVDPESQTRDQMIALIAETLAPKE